jgi:hypothetical protein
MLTVLRLIAMLIFLHMWLLDVLRREERRRQRNRQLLSQKTHYARRADDDKGRPVYFREPAALLPRKREP